MTRILDRVGVYAALVAIGGAVTSRPARAQASPLDALPPAFAARAAQPASATGSAQPTPPTIAVAAEGVTQELRLKDGSVLVGRVEAVAGDRVTFRLSTGATVDLALADITSLVTVEGRVVASQFWKDDPNPTRLFFGPTARPLAKGQVYLGVYELFLPFVQVGITDRLSIGGGTPLVFGGGGDRPFWFTPKFTLVNGARTQVAAGAMHVLNIDGDNLGIVYGAMTHGTRDSALSIGVGVAYERFEDASPPILMVGGEHRVGRNLKLVSENYVFDGGGIISGGVRFMTGHLSADLGLAAPLGVDELVVFPMVNFVWTFR